MTKDKTQDKKLNVGDFSRMTDIFYFKKVEPAFFDQECNSMGWPKTQLGKNIFARNSFEKQRWRKFSLPFLKAVLVIL